MGPTRTLTVSETRVSDPKPGPAFTGHATTEQGWRRPLATLPWPARVQDFRRVFVAEPSLFRVAVLATRVFISVRDAFAHVHACESAALTRSGAPCPRVLQGDVPQRRHEGPQHLDPFLGTAWPRVNFSARQHGAHLGMRVRFTPQPACTCSPLTIALRSTCCCSVLRGRWAPSPPSRTISP